MRAGILHSLSKSDTLKQVNNQINLLHSGGQLTVINKASLQCTLLCQKFSEWCVVRPCLCSSLCRPVNYKQEPSRADSVLKHHFQSWLVLVLVTWAETELSVVGGLNKTLLRIFNVVVPAILYYIKKYFKKKYLKKYN